ncbi:MAG: DEAD/DEAH box helicase [Patescibacteria group bacterium]
MYQSKFSKSRSFGRFSDQASNNRRPVRRGVSRPSAGKFGRSQRIDISKFINKAVITETAEHFIPEHKFSEFNIDSRLKENILSKGYDLPTPIQDKAIPHILRGSDIVGIANTGTGKTGAFLIPLIQKAIADKKEKILIVAPTRELAMQINQEFKSFARNLKMFSACCVGGAPIGRQISELRYHNNFVIGTPGRLKDLMIRKNLNLSGFNSVVLDEADRMLDMGFINDMKFIMSHMPEKRQTLFFSATMSREIDGLIRSFLREPISISVKIGDTPKSVDQDIVKVSNGSKIDTLHNLLKDAEFSKVLIFGKTKFGVERLSKILIERGFKAESIHGDKNLNKRQKALDLFKNNRVQILVATDVAARGLDILNVSHVINYDLPATYDDYVHRIGRTGRGNKKGKALTFIE